MFWLIAVLIASACYAFSNVIDNYFSNKIFRDIPSLVFYASLFNILFIPLVFLKEIPSFPTLTELPYFIILGFTGVAYLFPYYKALQHDDTSIVVSLFSLGKIFVPFLAFFLVNERLSIFQYLGFIIIIISSALLTWNNTKKLRLNASFYYMFIVAFLIAIEGVIYKHLFNSASWATGLVWSLVFTFIFSLPLFLVPKNRHNIISQLHHFKRNFHYFLIEELATFGGTAFKTLAITTASITLVEGMMSFLPFFVLLYALLFSRLFPNSFKEKITVRDLIKKGLLFILMVVGVILSLQ